MLYELPLGVERIKEIKNYKRDAAGNLTLDNTVFHIYSGVQEDDPMIRMDTRDAESGTTIRKVYFNGNKNEEKQLYANNYGKNGVLISDETYFYNSDADNDGYSDDAQTVTIGTASR